MQCFPGCCACTTIKLLSVEAVRHRVRQVGSQPQCHSATVPQCHGATVPQVCPDKVPTRRKNFVMASFLQTSSPIELWNLAITVNQTKPTQERCCSRFVLSPLLTLLGCAFAMADALLLLDGTGIIPKSFFPQALSLLWRPKICVPALTQAGNGDANRLRRSCAMFIGLLLARL